MAPSGGDVRRISHRQRRHHLCRWKTAEVGRQGKQAGIRVSTPASRTTRSKEEARNTTDKLTGFPPQDTVGRKGRGRPPGKKSDPKTTQAGGYVDDDLYLDVQTTLTQLKRRFTKRSEVNVSTLMGALFSYFQGLSADEQESFLRKYSEIDNYEK